MLKEIVSPTYGKYFLRKIATMSVFTFDAENPDDFKLFDAYHPTKHFSTLSIVKTDKEGVFEIWIPLKRDNLEWDFKGKQDTFQRMKITIKKGELPIAISAKTVIKWFKSAERFLIDCDNDIIDELYDEVEKDTSKEQSEYTNKKIGKK